MSINCVCVTGNLTRDPEIKATNSGTQVLNFTVAVNDRFHNKVTNQWEDRPNYIDCVMFGNRAQSLANILHKGMKVAIEGKLRWSQWEEQDSGKKRSKVEIVVDGVEFMSQGGGSIKPNQGAPQAAAQPQGYAPAAAVISDSDIPF